MDTKWKRSLTAFVLLFAFLAVHFTDRVGWASVPFPDPADIVGGQAAWVCPTLGVLFGLEVLFGQAWAALGTAVAAGMAGCL
jgi:hypothetical protein